MQLIVEYQASPLGTVVRHSICLHSEEMAALALFPVIEGGSHHPGQTSAPNAPSSVQSGILL